MTDRAQADSGGLIAVAVLGIASIVAILVGGQISSHLPGPGTVENVCLGVCGCGACPPAFYALSVIGLLVFVASYVISVPDGWPPDSTEREQS